VIAVNLRIGGVQLIELLRALFGHLAYARNSLTSKEQVMRIEVAGLDETLRLLGASTRVVPVNQTAFVLHEIVQVPSGACESLSERLGTDFKQFCTDSVRHAEDVSKGINEPLLAIEAQQHAGCAADSRFLNDQSRPRPYVSNVIVACSSRPRFMFRR
jgi:hypothetical protein